MVGVEPLRGYLFQDPNGGDASLCAAPPYDVLDEDERAVFADQSPANVVHLTLPLPQAGQDRYSVARSILETMIADGRLSQDEDPSFYLQDATFQGVDRQTHVRNGLIGLVPVETIGEGVVLGHEQVMPKPIEDRYRLLETTQANLEPVFFLYDDPLGEVESLLADIRTQTPLTSAHVEGVQFDLRRSNTETTDALCRILSDKKLYIADGHHRYTVAGTFKDRHPELSGASQRMALLVSAQDPGLLVLPTHRFVDNLNEEAAKALESRLHEHFDLTPSSRDEILQALDGTGDHGTLGIRIGDPIRYMVATPKNTVSDAMSDYPEPLGELDVVILHRFLIDPDLLGHELTYRYVRGEQDPLGKAEEEAVPLAFFLRPPTVETVLKVSDLRLFMPPKSTYFYPKAASGQVLHRINS